ncbi:MAG: radical SAM protein [Parcubacteria group bacterium]|nr:radical SAM protein [Parcubacteria group bacterium]
MKRLYFASLNDCNEDCLFCVRRGDASPIEFIDTKKAKEILLKKRKQGYEGIYFDGGEPTLRKDLIELVQFAKDKKFRVVSILTNGVLLSKDKLVKDLLSVKNTKNFSLSFSISLHSHRKDISEKLVARKNTFNKTIKGIENLIKNGCRNLSLYRIITKYNYRDLPTFVNFVHKKFPQIKNITFSFIYPAGAALKNKNIFPRLSKVESYFQEALNLCKKYEISFSITTCGTIPLCFLKGYEYLLINQQELDRPENVGLIDSSQDGEFELATKEFHQETKIKASWCADCLYNDKCGGIWRTYVEMYGIDELKPVLKKGQDKNKRPKVLLLLTGFSCNNNCIFCSNVADRNFNSPTEELLKKIDQGYEQGFRILEFIGGEVTIRPDFFDLVSYAKKIGFEDIQITSNGRLFSYPEFTKKAWQAGLKGVVVSLYGHNKKLHDGVTRTPGSFEQCLQGIKNISKIKGMNLIINTVVSKINYKFLYQIGRFIHQLGIREWHPLELLPDGRGMKHYDALAVPYKKLSPYMKKLGKLAGHKIKRIDFFDFPFCLFNKDLLDNKNINYFTPQRRYEDIEIQAHDPASRVDKIIQGKKIIYQDKYKTKPSFCRNCLYFYQCGGIAKPYFKRYQDKEIRELAKKHQFINEKK